VTTVNVDGRALHYERAGAGDSAPIVFLHGGLIDSRVWDPQFAWFSERADVIRFDLPGNGRSEPPAGSVSGFELLRAALTGLGVERAVLVGLSGGARIAIDFAIRYPESAGKLVAVAPGLSGYDRWSLPEGAIDAMRTNIEAGDRDGAAEAWLDLWAPVTKSALVPLGRDNADSLFRNIPLEELEPPAIGRLDELVAPTLVIVGDRDVLDIQAIADLIVRGAPVSEKRIFAGADHFPNVHDPTAFNEAVAAFLSLS
jgi:3-oxoadipate enol-lactonase